MDLNDKTVGPRAPSEGIKYLGVVLRTDPCSYHVFPKYAEYVRDKFSNCLHRKWVSLKELESVVHLDRVQRKTEHTGGDSYILL